MESVWHIGDLRRIPPGKMDRSEKQPSQTGGTDHGPRTALGPKFVHKGSDMKCDGVPPDVEAIGHSLVGQSLGDKLEHFEFPACQGHCQFSGQSLKDAFLETI